MKTTKEKEMKKILTTAFVICVLLIPATFAQGNDKLGLSDSEIQLLRSDVQSAKNQIISDTMKFTEKESQGFWPVYADFAREQQRIGDERLGVIRDFANKYDTLTDNDAKDLVQRFMNVEDKTLNLREDYWKRFEAALGAKRAAKFYQVDNRLTLMINIQLASAIPLVK